MAGRIISAAIRLHPDGPIRTGPDHAVLLSAVIREGGRPVEWTHGFVDADGDFLDRAGAYKRAVACRQIVADGGPKVLTSEMMREGGR